MSKFSNQKCQSCGNTTNIKKLSYEIADIFLCKKSCIYTRPKVNTNSLYTPEYFKDNYETRITTQAKTSHKISSFLKKHIPKGSILDYGCGTGSFLLTAEEFGFTQNIGIDVSDYSTSLAQSKAKSSNFTTTQSSLENKKFDCISFIDSIAHIEDMNAVLSKLIKNNLKSDGFILIRTPNISKLYLLYVLLIRNFFPKSYQASFFFVPHRLFLFNKTSIQLFLTKYNLDIKEIYTEPDYKKTISFHKDISIKSLIDYFIRLKIPSLINRNNSMTLIAKFK